MNYKFMNHQQAEYFKKLVQKNSPASIAISQYFVNLRQEDLVPFINNDTKKCISSHRVKTQNLAQSKGQKALVDQESTDILKHLPKKYLYSQQSINLQKITKEEEKLLKKYEQQLIELKASKKLPELSNHQPGTSLEKLKNLKQVAAFTRKQRELVKIIEQLHKLKKEKIQKQEKQQTGIKERKEFIVQRLKKLGQYKNRRQDILTAKSLPALPKYKVMEKNLIAEETKNQLQKNGQSKKSKEQKYRNYLGLGSLKEQRVNRINSQLTKINKYLKTDDSLKNFNRKELQQKKSQFLKEVRQKRKQKVIKVDKAKELQVAILKDKEKNPLKYNFLKLKNLKQEQIFRDFKDYELNFDSKEIGNQYLQESKLNAKPKSNKVTEDERNQSAKRQRTEARLLLGSENSPIPKQNTNRQNRVSSQNVRDQKAIAQKSLFSYKQKIYKLLRNSQSKSKVVQLLSEQSAKKQKSMVQLQQQLQSSLEYEECMKIQKSIDSKYLELLKAKIVALKIQQ